MADIRPWTEDRRNSDGSKTCVVKTACTSCGRLLGDTTEEEIERSIEGLPLLDSSLECGCTARESQTVSPTWAVHIQGMDDVMPALGRRDAHRRAHKVNTTAVWHEVNREPDGLDMFRPTVWAVPVAMNPSPFEPELAAAEVEAMWEEWGK